jgi:hypothetical protein
LSSEQGNLEHCLHTLQQSLAIEDPIPPFKHKPSFLLSCSVYWL